MRLSAMGLLIVLLAATLAAQQATSDAPDAIFVNGKVVKYEGVRIGMPLAPVAEKVAQSVAYVRSQLGDDAWNEGMHPELPTDEEIENPYTYTEGDARVTAASED